MKKAFIIAVVISYVLVVLGYIHKSIQYDEVSRNFRGAVALLQVQQGLIRQCAEHLKSELPTQPETQSWDETL